MNTKHWISLGASLIALVTPTVDAQLLAPVSQQLDDPKAADVTIVGHVLEPKQLDIHKHLRHVRLPPGFEINVFADELKNPRMIAVAADGTVYVTRRSVGDVLMLRDTDGDGRADQKQVVARRPNMHGIAIDGDTVYLAAVNEVYKSKIRADGTFEPLEQLVNDLPDGGQHPNRTIVVGPDKKLYVSVGSTCNACGETNPESATILQMEPDGSSRKIFASGLRNTIGFGFAPESNRLFGMDHGIDWLGDNEQYEELNEIVQGNQYGWPYIYGDGKFNPQDEPPASVSLREWAERSVSPLGFYTPHAAPMQMTFYTGDAFPPQYNGDAFVAMRGSWNRKPPSGYEVARIRFADGEPIAFEAFATGFLVRQEQRWHGWPWKKGWDWSHGRGKVRTNDWGHKGRLAGIAQTPAGELLLSDDTNGIIYRIAYTGNEVNRWGPGDPTNSAGLQIGVAGAYPPAPRGENEAGLIMDLLMGADSLEVSSPAFDAGESIPESYAAEAENISPPLQWQAGPKGTVSYAVFMEDPDVANNAPFVHWQLYNIPAETTALPEGIPAMVELLKPEGARQGMNDRGAVGYFGPRPPKGAPAHSYHFQVFALDGWLHVPVKPTRQELLAAMEGHVLASGEIVGTFSRE